MLKKSWKALLKQHNQLKADSSATLFDRVTILSKIWNDPQYKIDQQKAGKPVMELLNSCVSDTCANASELIQMLKMFPRKLQWAQGDLSLMRSQMLQHLAKQQSQAHKSKASSNGVKPPITRSVISHAQYNELKEEAKTKCETLEEENKRLREEVKQLREELSLARETIKALTKKTLAAA